MKLKIVLIVSIVFIVFLAGCNQKYPQSDTVYTTIETETACPINTTPTVFLYPAINLNSHTPEFFKNTEYEIIKDGDYLGKFRGDRFNTSYLNISVGDYLDMIVSAESDKCYVFKESITHKVSCDNIQYINPQLECAEEFSAKIFSDEINWKLEDEVSEENPIRTQETKVKLFIRTKNKGRFNAFGCSIDRKLIRGYSVKTARSRLLYSLADHSTMKEYDTELLYILEEDDDYNLIFDLYESMFEPFNTTIQCTFFDTEYYIDDYEIERDIADSRYNFLGQPEKTFIFTIFFEGY